MDASTLARFIEKAIVGDGCWGWTGATLKPRHGRRRYAVLGMSRRQARSAERRATLAHRLAYEHFVGPVPEGMELDHVESRGCVEDVCVSPYHVEPVTHKENVLRGGSFAAANAKKTHCKRGHSLEGAYLIPGGGRSCRPCMDLQYEKRRGSPGRKVYMRARYLRMKEEGLR